MTSVVFAQPGYTEVGTSSVGLQLLIGAIAAVCLALFLFSLIDAIRRPSSVWRSARSSKPLWIALILILQVLGAIAYLSGVRGRLKAVTERSESG